MTAPLTFTTTITTTTTVDAEPYQWPLVGSAVSDTTAVLVIDMQLDFLSPDGWFARVIGADPVALRDAVGPVQQVLTAARAARIPVIHTRQGNAADLSDLPPVKRAQNDRQGAPIGSTGPLGRGLVRGETGWEIAPEVAPVPGEHIVDKPGFGAFRDTSLLALLESLGTRQLVLTGVTANVCVLSTLLEAVDRGYDCVTVTDAIAGVDTAVRDGVVDLIRYQHGLFGAVTTAAAVAAGFSRLTTPA